MRELIAETLNKAGSLPEVQDLLLKLISGIRTSNAARIGIISGIVSSDGMDRIPENMASLRQYTTLMVEKYPGSFFFSAADIFTTVVYSRLPEFQLPRPGIDYAFMGFWRGILTSGIISDVSFTPRWRKSLGASDEHKTVTEISLQHQFIMQPLPGILLVRRCCT